MKNEKWGLDHDTCVVSVAKIVAKEGVQGVSRSLDDVEGCSLLIGERYEGTSE